MSAVPSIPAIPPLRVRLPNGSNVTKTVRTVRDRQQQAAFRECDVGFRLQAAGRPRTSKDCLRQMRSLDAQPRPLHMFWLTHRAIRMRRTEVQFKHPSRQVQLRAALKVALPGLLKRSPVRTQLGRIKGILKIRKLGFAVSNCICPENEWLR